MSLMLISFLKSRFILNFDLDIPFYSNTHTYPICYNIYYLENYVNGGIYMGRNYSNKNLTELEMRNIEFYLNEGKCPAEIGSLLGKDPSGIRKEVKKYSSFFGSRRKCSNCLNKDNCYEKYLCDKLIDRVKCSKCKYCIKAVKYCPNYKTDINCELLKKNHHVCNGNVIKLKLNITLKQQ